MLLFFQCMLHCSMRPQMCWFQIHSYSSKYLQTFYWWLLPFMLLFLLWDNNSVIIRSQKGILNIFSMSSHLMYIVHIETLFRIHDKDLVSICLIFFHCMDSLFETKNLLIFHSYSFFFFLFIFTRRSCSLVF